MVGDGDFVVQASGDGNITWPCFHHATLLDSQGDEFDRLQVEVACEAAERLANSGYCLIQMPEDEELQRHMEEWCASQEPYFTQMAVNFRTSYLGEDSDSKIRWVGGGQDEEEDPGLMALDLVGHSEDGARAMEAYTTTLEDLQRAVGEACNEYLGFLPSSDNRFGTLLRRVAFDSERRNLGAARAEDEDLEEGTVAHHVNFLRCRRVSLLYMVSGSAKVVVTPRDRFESLLPGANLLIKGNQCLLFRHDCMSYSYTSHDGADLALQAWLADDLHGDDILQLPPREYVTDPDLLGAPSGKGANTHVVAVANRFSGMTNGIDQLKTGFTSCLDGAVCMPSVRFNLELYYADEDLPGKSRVKHCNVLDMSVWTNFDNDLFEIPYEKAAMQDVGTRVSLEIAYAALHNGGINRFNSRGKHVAFFHGDVYNLDQVVGCTAFAHMQHFYGFVGMSTMVDTACSTGLVATALTHQEVCADQVDFGLAVAVNRTLDVFSFVAMSIGRMISFRGRSRTFDTSADGYGRAEGCAGLFIEVEKKSRERGITSSFGRLLSSRMNQDGKSASLTAPAGPAQTACIQASLQESGIDPEDIAMTECHGTATNLGDPIEVGSLVFSMNAKSRVKPIAISGAKSNIGHVESGAGMVGLLRCILSCITTLTFPNCHLYCLNGHFQMEGFPSLMCSEDITTAKTCNINGVSSFGFGGTNSRAEMFACATPGHARAIDMSLTMPQTDRLLRRCPKCLGTMCWLCGLALSGAEEHICSSVRDESDSYELCSLCYEGGYQFGSSMLDLKPPVLRKVFLIGSWDRFDLPLEMALKSSGVYSCNIALGETRLEQFRLALEPNGTSVIHPCVHKADQYARVEGPADVSDGRMWQIDGWRDSASEGTQYEITFQWIGNVKSVAWKVAAELEPLPEEQVRAFARRAHVYSLSMESKGWAFLDMQPDDSDPALWTCTTTMCFSGKDEFVLVRDHDPGQTIYPNEQKTWDTSVPVMGPSDKSCGRSWAFHATPSVPVTFGLRVINGSIMLMVTTDTAESGSVKSVFKSQLRENSAGHTYSITGSFNGWGFIDMVGCLEDEIYRCVLPLADAYEEEFQIVVDRDPGRTYYPHMRGAEPGCSIVYGPDNACTDCTWCVRGSPGDVFEVTLNLRDKDRRKAVRVQSIRAVSALHNSGD